MARKKKQDGPKVLIYDIETAPIIAHVWRLWDQNVGLNQIECDWHLLSWSAKWLGDPPSKTIYMDQRKAKDITDDKKLLEGIWKLLDEADIVITQNGKSFDEKKLNARFILNGMKPPSSVQHVDTKRIAKKHFGFTSNSLAYMTDKLCSKHKKSSHKKYVGHSLWTGCLNGELAAWKEMEHYNKLDVLSLEELYKKLEPWDNSINYNLYTDTATTICGCGSTDFKKNGHAYTSRGKYQRYSCKKCGAEIKGSNNLFSKEKKESLKAKSNKSRS